jgi:phage shock protein PspC (stress-responsive transcriptional regulator)
LEVKKCFSLFLRGIEPAWLNAILAGTCTGIAAWFAIRHSLVTGVVLGLLVLFAASVLYCLITKRYR